MRSQNYYLFIVPFLLIFLSSCFKATEDAPAYVRINNFTFTADSATQGSSSSKIIDSWVYLDGKLLGIFQLPTTIPVLAVGSHSLNINAGVLNSGVESARLAYPFYEPFTKNITFSQNGMLTLSPTSKYRSNTEFKLNEGFEQGVPFEKGDGSDTTMIRITDPSIVFEGVGCAALIVDGDNDNLTTKSKNEYTFTGANTEIYVELNYMSNCDFDIGIIPHGSGDGQSISGFFSTGGVWKKTYIELSRTIHEVFPTVSSFKLFLRVKRDGDRSKDYKVYIDNLKLVNNK